MFLLCELLPGILDSVGRAGDCWWLHISAQNDMAPKVTCLRNAVAHDTAQRDVENSVQFFQCLLLGLGKEEENENPTYDVPSRIPRESACVAPSLH